MTCAHTSLSLTMMPTFSASAVSTFSVIICCRISCGSCICCSLASVKVLPYVARIAFARAR